MKRRRLTPIAVVVVAAIGLGGYYARRSGPPPRLITDSATRGSIVNVVSSTGTLEAVTTVQVGSQVSGTIDALYADFNSMVHKGQTLARLDQTTFVAALEQARGELASAQADAEQLRVAKDAADVALTRAQELSDRQLETEEDLQTAETTSKSAGAQVGAADAKIDQAKAAVEEAEVNLSKTVITSPIDGVVTARNVDVGQTVAASLQAPVLFIIAADLGQMQVNANIDESDVGQVRSGEPVTFRVDAYPGETFAGRVTQVRLDPSTTDNVVVYSAIIEAPNPKLELKPGMTATVTIEVARRDDVLRVPNAALRFRPDATVLASFAPKDPALPAATRGAPSSKTPTVWVLDGDTITPVAVTTGVSDATETELVNPPFAEGTAIVLRVASAAASTSTSPTNPSNNPLIPQRGPRPPGR